MSNKSVAGWLKIAVLAVFLLCVFSFPKVSRARDKYRVGILDFGILDYDEQESLRLTEIFRREIGRNPDFQWLTREEIQKGMVYDNIDKRELEQYECTGEACILQVGIRVKADFIFTGSVQKIKDSFYVAAKLVSIRKRNIVFTTNIKTQKKSEMDRLAVELAKKVVRWMERAGDSPQKREERKKIRIKEQKDMEKAFAEAQKRKFEQLAKRKPGTCPDEMVLIPAGKFIRGTDSSDPHHQKGDRKKKEVSLKEFCIDKHEFTYKGARKQYTQFEWYGAKYECEKQGKKLCSESQWEKACKGPEGQVYPYGNDYRKDTCNTGNPEGKAHKTGSKKDCVSGYGVYDMSGNKKEWVGLRMRGQYLVLRGGSYKSGSEDVRCASRILAIPFGSKKDYGFRCCKR